MKLFALFISILTAATLVSAQETASDRYRTVQTMHMTADQRIATYEKLLKAAPADPKTQAGLASAFIQKMRETADFAYLDRASAMVGKMLAADPKSYDGLRLSAEIETHRHNFPKAASLAADLTVRNPSDTGSWGMLGDSLMELGRYAEAAEAYKQMLTLAPNLASYNRVAYHSFVTGNANQALGWMQSAVQAGSPIAENLAWCLVEFGDMLAKTGHTQDAHSIYDRALETLPGYHRALAGLGRQYFAAGELERAAENFKKAQAVIPLPDYATELEAIYTKLGKKAEAQQQRELLDVIDKLGQVNGEKGNRALAIAYADENRNLDRALSLAEGELAGRKDVYTYDALSWVLFRSGRQKEAEAASAKAMAEKTPEPLFWYHAGKIAIGAGHEAEGKELVQRALALNPTLEVRGAATAAAGVRAANSAPVIH